MPFARVVSYFLNQHKGAYQRELDDLLPIFGAPAVSDVAFCKARRKLSSKVFSTLNDKLISQVQAALPGLDFHGHRVFAIDSTVLNLPRLSSITRAFSGQPKRRGGKIEFPMARHSVLLDVGTGLIWQSSLEPYSLSEQVAAAEHLSALPESALTLYDRGYPSFFLMALHRKLGLEFCMRMPRKFTAQIDALFASQSAARVITLTANADQTALCREHGVDSSPISLRLARVELATEIEVLASSLTDENRYPEADFGALYHQRWRIEERIKHLKSRLQLENWSGKSVLSLRQDVHARVLTSNLVRVITYLAQQRLDQQHAQALAAGEKRQKRRINQTHALHCLRHVLLAYLLAPRTETLVALVQKVLQKTHAVRENRHAKREKTLGKSVRYPMAYKQTA